MKKLSFRDPLAEVYLKDDQIIRKIKPENLQFFAELFKRDFFKKMINENWIQNSKITNANGSVNLIHNKIENFTEITEMSSYQLFLSGIHTLDIANESLRNGYMIKDASAWNTVFFKGKPLFLDIGSFEKWDNKKIWLGYGQFVRHFIIPLILNKELQIPISKLFLFERDGVYPDEAKKRLGLKVFKSLSYLEFVFAPSILKSSRINMKKNPSENAEINKKILLSILKRLKKKLLSLEPSSSSFWTDYAKKRDHYSQKDIEIKKEIVEEFFKKNNGKTLDIGCNTGEFLYIASKYCSETHGIDIDENCINLIQKNLNNQNISLSNINISNPTPGVGWMNGETSGYIKKNLNYFDNIIFFGIVHHLVVTDRIPILSIIELLASLTKRNLIFEFVSNKDERFLDLANINIDLYQNFTKENFENLIQKSFKIIKTYDLEYNSNRNIYILEKKI